MSTKTSIHPYLFLLISTGLHVLMLFFIVFAPFKDLLTERNTAPIFVDVVELPPDTQGEKEKPLKPAKWATDRNIKVE